MKPLHALLALAVLTVTLDAHAQIDPGVMPTCLLTDLEDGSLIAEVAFTQTRPGTADGYEFVGEEGWYWVDDTWPARAMVLGGGEGTGAEVDALYHQALFPEEADHGVVPDGDRTYALTRHSTGEQLGWLVVEDAEAPGSDLTWALLDDAEVGELFALDEDELLLEPATPPGERLWLRIIAQSQL